MPTADLLSIRIETSISPPITVRASDWLAPTPTSPAASFALGLLRPRVVISSDLLGEQVIEPYGPPFPWWVGLALVVGGIMVIHAQLR